MRVLGAESRAKIVHRPKIFFNYNSVRPCCTDRSLRGVAPAREPDRVVHGSSDCGLEGRTTLHARRSAALLGFSDHHGADAAGGFPPGATPDRRVDRIPSGAAWS